MGRDQDRGDAGFEWVNAWAEVKRPDEAAQSEPSETPVAVAPASAMRPVTALPADQLMRDIAEIERVRDALALLPVAPMPVAFSRRTQALTLVPARTTDPVPVVIGGVLALVMLTVFGAAAAMSKFAR
jgi:hypothetical protein